MKIIKKNIYYIFRIIPSDFLLFLSGIFVATGVNMITSTLPQSIKIIDERTVLLALLFLIMAAVLNYWAFQINKLNLLASNKIKILLKQNKEKELWYKILTDPQYYCIKKALLFCLLISIILLVSIILLILFPIDFRNFPWIAKDEQ